MLHKNRHSFFDYEYVFTAICSFFLIFFLSCWCRCGSRIFSGRGGGFFELDFSSSPKALFWPKFLRCRQNFEKTSQKGVLGFFGKVWPKNRVFSARASPYKLVYIGAKDYLPYQGYGNFSKYTHYLHYRTLLYMLAEMSHLRAALAYLFWIGKWRGRL